jgi:hypothetical protein
MKHLTNIKKLKLKYTGKNVLDKDLNKIYKRCIDDYKRLIKKKKLKISDIIILGNSLYNIGLIHDSREEYNKAIYYYNFSARFYNYKAIINLLFHFDKDDNTIMFTTYLKKLKNIYTKYKQYMEPKYIEKCKNIIKKYQYLL